MYLSRFIGFLILPAAFLTFGAESLHASFTFNVLQVGTNVVVTGTGTINTSALTPYLTSNEYNLSHVWAQEGELVGGPSTLTACEAFTGSVGPSTFDRYFYSESIIATSGGGDLVGIDDAYLLTVPAGYISGSALSDIATYSQDSFSYLDLYPGSYVYTWGSGPTADSLTINIGVVPEPASLAIVGIPAALSLLRRRRVRSV